MLTIQHDPAGATGRDRRPWDYSLTIQANVERHLQGGGGCSVLLNGELIDPATHQAMERLPTVADELLIVRRPEGFDPFSWYAILAYVAIATVAVVSLMPRPDLSGMAAGKDSPNNRLTAQTNTARAYQGIPDVYGSRRVWPDMIQPSVVEYRDHVKFVTEWLCISRGRGDVSAVQYADTPIGDIPGASYELFAPMAGPDGYPENGVTTLANVLETFAAPEVNGQELEYPRRVAPADYAATLGAVTGSQFTVPAPLLWSADAPQAGDVLPVRVTIPAVPAAGTDPGTPEVLLFNGNAEVLSIGGTPQAITFAGALTGATAGASVRVQISTAGATVLPLIVGPYTLPLEGERLRWNTIFQRGLKGSVAIRATWWRIDADGNELPGTRQTRDDTYSADTFDARYWTADVTPSAGRGRYRVQFERLTAQIGDQGADVAKLEALYAVRRYATKALPGVTVVRITTRATEQATGYSERKFNARWARHVRTLTTNTLSHSRNAFRAMAHIWTLAGCDMAELDVDAMQEINDVLGEDSLLLRFDMSLDDVDLSLGERLQLVADHARCRVWRDGTRWTVTRDQRQAVPRHQLDYRTLASDGESAHAYSAHLPASHDGVEVEYVSEAEQNKKAYIRINISSGAPVVGVSRNQRKLRFPGCTTESQAMNRAQLEARRLLYSRESVQDTVLSDAGQLGILELVRWIDPADFDGQDDGLQAGEVLCVSGNVLAVSEPLEWQGQSVGRILLTGASGQPLGAPVLCYPDAGGVRLASVPAGLFVADGADVQLGSRYAFGVGITGAELEEAGLFTVEKAEPTENGVSVTLAQYDARVYEYDD